MPTALRHFRVDILIQIDVERNARHRENRRVRARIELIQHFPPPRPTSARAASARARLSQTRESVESSSKRFADCRRVCLLPAYEVELGLSVVRFDRLPIMRRQLARRYIKHHAISIAERHRLVSLLILRAIEGLPGDDLDDTPVSLGGIPRCGCRERDVD